MASRCIRELIPAHGQFGVVSLPGTTGTPLLSYDATVVIFRLYAPEGVEDGDHADIQYDKDA
jgi:hypothetical protein